MGIKPLFPFNGKLCEPQDHVLRSFVNNWRGEKTWNRLIVKLSEALYRNLRRGNKKTTKKNYNLLEVEI